MISLYITTLAMGFFGSLHCVGMCGGITIAINQAIAPEKQLRLTFLYQLFRIVSYAFLGLLFAFVGSFLQSIQVPILNILSGVFMILLGLYLMHIKAPLIVLEKLGHKAWRLIKPIQQKLLPINSNGQAIGVGLLWGLLPCGLVYSALVVSASSGSAIHGLISMLFFGIGTLPMMISVGLISQNLISKFNNINFRRFIGVLFIIWGLFFIYSAANHQHATTHKEHHSHHQH